MTNIIKKKKAIKEEAQAFNRHISDRIAKGFIPDIRRAVKCNYFYKSFWRDPHFVNLYVGKHVKTFIELLKKYGHSGMSVLDVGCGAGYISLELARAGFHVVGIDIADKAIDIAQKTLSENPYKKNFGSLEYQEATLDEISGKFDAILFSGVLHHLDAVVAVLKKSKNLLKRDGLLLCAEPLHDAWRIEDATQVAFIRAILSLTGQWYEKVLGKYVAGSEKKFKKYALDIFTEYVTERDKHEKGGQSPHDNSTPGTQILKILRKSFNELEYRDSNSFIYRVLGGLRGPDKQTHAIADLLTLYEKIAVDLKIIRPNGFFFIGKNN